MGWTSIGLRRDDVDLSLGGARERGGGRGSAPALADINLMYVLTVHSLSMTRIH